MAAVVELRQLALRGRHAALGARFGEFAGFEMPLWYAGAIEEHLAVREHAGVFDISHMGRFRVAGPDAASALAAAFTRDPARLALNGSIYALACDENGGIVDDLLVYRLGADDYLVICNAANSGAVGAMIDAELERVQASSIDLREGDRVLLAVQGPDAVDAVALLLGDDVHSIGRHACREVTVVGAAYLLCRTGYTGEDGFEVMTSAAAGDRLLASLIEAGVRPTGLAARDSLRLEAALPLHGHDIDTTTTPWEAGLSWAVELDHAFSGRDALARLKDETKRRLACLVADAPGVIRMGCDVFDGESFVGTVTSGGFSPMLNTSIALAYLPRPLAREGRALEVELRGRRIACHTVKRPFYARPSEVPSE